MSLLQQFHQYIRLEKNLSQKTVEAYISDMKKWYSYLNPDFNDHDHDVQSIDDQVIRLTLSDIQQYLEFLYKSGIQARSQARVISSMKAFYKFLWIQKYISEDPTQLLESPKIGRKLPEFLSIPEVEALINAIDLSTPEGHRN
jgi:integrase/recombinase XerD